MPSRKYAMVFNLWMSVFMASAFSLVMPLMQGAPTVEFLGPHGWLVGFGIGLVVGWLVSTVLPLGMLCMKAALRFGAKPGSFAANLFAAMLMGFLLLVFMGFAMIAYNTGFEVMGGSTLFDRVVVGIVQFTPIVVVFVVIVYPLCQKALGKLPLRVMNLLAAVVVIGFVVLCAVKFA